MNELVIIRGIAGAGKSTYAQQFIDKGYKHFEADMYFYISGNYIFDAGKLSKAHEWCFNKTSQFLKDGHNVVVANTFTRLWEMEKYLDFVTEQKIPFKVIRLNTRYKNVHGVPENVVDNMINRFEDYPNEVRIG